MTVWGAALIWAVMVNAVTYVCFAVDKRRARDGGWRIPEATLLNLTLLGGWPAAKLAQRRLRHKTRKQPFASRLNLMIVLNVLTVSIALATAYSPDFRAFAGSAMAAMLP